MSYKRQMLQLRLIAACATVFVNSFMLFFRVGGPLAQLVEHLPFKQGVAGSNPARLISIQCDASGNLQGCAFFSGRVRIGCGIMAAGAKKRAGPTRVLRGCQLSGNAVIRQTEIRGCPQ